MTVDRLKGISLSDGDSLAPYWQTHPVILERALDVSILVPDTDTIIEILTETDMPSRIFIGREGEEFSVEYGPFNQFTAPKKPWTVLIHALEHLFPEYDQIRKSMSWLPHWRFEDCMLSWASKDGSVGRHFDQFSVFLIQLNGCRAWEIGPKKTSATEMVPNQSIALVNPVAPDATWIAKPGDVLYLPPNVIHHGVSQDPDCMTLSIGFRAPDSLALLEAALETCDQVSTTHRFNDPRRLQTGGAGEILPEDLKEARATIIRHLDEPGVMEHIFATRVSAPYLDLDSNTELAESEINLQFQSTTHWDLDPGCRMAYVNSTLYINGERIGDETPAQIIQLANTRSTQSSKLYELDEFWLSNVRELIRTELLIPSENDRS